MSYEFERESLENADDRIVAGRAADGDTVAFAVLVRRYTPMMQGVCAADPVGLCRRGRRVAGRVHHRVGAARAQLQDPGQAKSWLMRITSRKAIDRVRVSRSYTDLTEMELPAPERIAPPRQAEANAGVAALNEALLALPDAQRECWVLREFGGYTYREIAEQLDVSVSTVRGLLARARKDIIVRMEDWR